MMTEKTELIEVGVDYIRVTTNKEGDNEYLERIGYEYQAGLPREGDITKPCSKLGYDGSSSGTSFIGRRPDGVMFQISGRVPARCLHALDFDRVHVTRIDLQFTVRLPQYSNDFGYRNLLAAEKWRDEQENKLNWAKIRRIDGRGAGDTVFIGSRQSESYGRLYDKHMESRDNEYKTCWRYEVEYKGTKAVRAASILAGRKWAARTIYSMCAAQFTEWGFPRLLHPVESIELPIRDRDKSDTARKLEWLKKQVAPTVTELIDYGYEDDVLCSLFPFHLDRFKRE